MDDKIPWTGGISNRQIFIDGAISVLAWLVIGVPLAVLLWWVCDIFSVPDRFRASVIGLAGVGSVTILGFIKLRRKSKKS